MRQLKMAVAAGLFPFHLPNRHLSRTSHPRRTRSMATQAREGDPFGFHAPLEASHEQAVSYKAAHLRFMDCARHVRAPFARRGSTVSGSTEQRSPLPSAAGMNTVGKLGVRHCRILPQPLPSEAWRRGPSGDMCPFLMLPGNHLGGGESKARKRKEKKAHTDTAGGGRMTGSLFEICFPVWSGGG